MKRSGWWVVVAVLVVIVSALFVVEATLGAPKPTAPVPPPEPYTLSGTGTMVTEPIHAPAGVYVVDWSATGRGNFIVHATQQGLTRYLVNEIPPNPPSGQTRFVSNGGSYIFTVEASSLRWSLTFTWLSS